jgi:Glycosyl transferases group 1
MRSRVSVMLCSAVRHGCRRRPPHSLLAALSTLACSSDTILTVSPEDGHVYQGMLATLPPRLRAFGLNSELAAVSAAGGLAATMPIVAWAPFAARPLARAIAGFAARQGVLFAGNRHPIAMTGISWYLTQVQPLVWERLHANGKLSLVGTGWDDLHSLAKDPTSVVLRGEISAADLHELCETSKVFVAPLFEMTGVATKIIAAMARSVLMHAKTQHTVHILTNVHCRALPK